MARFVAAALLLLAPGSEALVVAGSKERPVMKVVRLLQDMQAQLQKDLDDDRAVHQTLDCWCKNNDQEKTAAIEMGEARENQLNSFLGEAAAKMQELKVKRDGSLDEVNKDEAALQEASALRMKESQAFHAEDTDLMEAIKACDQAIVVLGKHNTNLAQVRAIAQQLQTAQVLNLAAHRSFRASDMLALRSFLLQAQGSAPSFLQIPGMQGYAPQSGQIFGILQQMKSDFERDLSAAAAKEKEAAEQYASLKAAKEEEIHSGRKLVSELDQQIAELQEKHAQAFKELEDTKAQLDLDRTFLSNLKAKCSASDAEFDQRVKDRLEEISAVQDTIKILNDDAAFANFDTTVNSFVQIAASSTQEQRVSRAVAVLTRAAAVSGMPELTLLAARVKIDAFAQVKVEIDKMVVQLKQQQKDESEHRDWCIDELSTNKRQTEGSYDTKASLEVKIADLTQSIKQLSEEIATTIAAVDEMQTQMKRASETREAENADYQQTVADQRLTQTILAKALDRMRQVYAMVQEEPQPGAPHIETSGTDTDPGNGPARFTKYEKHGGGGRVLRMLETVVADSKKTENEAIQSEQDAQGAYENFMQDSNKAISAYSEKIMNLKGAEAKAHEDLTMGDQDLKATMHTLEELNGVSGDLHKSCDFIMDTFDARQAARTAEIEALGEAKAILSGMK